MALSSDQLKELKEAFATFDTNGAGVISKDELSTLLMGLGEDVNENTVTEMMKLAVTDNEGQVNFEKFCKDIDLQEILKNLTKAHCAIQKKDSNASTTLLIGGTGAGKSTLCAYLAGKPLKVYKNN